MYKYIISSTFISGIILLAGCQSPAEEDESASATFLQPILTDRQAIQEQELITEPGSVGLSPSGTKLYDFGNPTQEGKDFRHGGY